MSRFSLNSPSVQEIITETQDDFAAPRPTPNNPPWNGWVAFGVWFSSIVFIVFVPMIFVFPYIVSKGPGLLESPDLKEFLMTDPTAAVLGLAPVILAHFLTLLLSWLVVTQMNRYSFRKTLGWKWGGFKFWHAVAILVGLYAFVIAMLTIFGDVETDFDKVLKSSRWAVYLVAFFATFTAPLVEEVVYRGMLYSAFQRRFGIIFAVVFVTILFTIIHIPQYSRDSLPDYAAASSLLMISLVLTFIRVRTDNLLPCIVLHTLFNGVQSVVLLLEPYLLQTGSPAENPASILFP